MLDWLTKTLRAMRHPAARSGALAWFGAPAGGSRLRHDYASEVGAGLDSSLIMAPILWAQRTVASAPLVVETSEGEARPAHPLAALMARPNPAYSASHLIAATVLSLLVPGGGNAYWLKVRNGAGRVVELWYAPHWLITPRWPSDGSAWLSHYDYRPGGETVSLPPQDVVHLRQGVDPLNPRLGASPLNAILREAWADEEIGVYVAALLRNNAMPGLVISPDGPGAVGPADVESIKRYLAEQFGGERRGAPMVFSAKTKVERVAWNPKELDLTAASNRAEERVCALLGIPPVVVGFHAGTTQTSVGATMREQVRLAWHDCVLPMQRAIAAEIERSLLPDLEQRPAGLRVLFDTSDVLALGEETAAVVARAVSLVDAGIATLAEARKLMGLPVDDTHDIYLRRMGQVEVPGDTGLRPVPPDPAPAQALPAAGKAASRGQIKHAHSGFEERLAHEARHAEPTAAQEQFVGRLEAARLRYTRRFSRDLRKLFADLGKRAAEAAAPILAETEGLEPPKQRSAHAAKLTPTMLDQLRTDRVLEAMGLPSWQGLLRERYERTYISVAEDAAAASAGVLRGVAAGVAVSLADPVGRAVIATAGRRAGLVDLAAQSKAALFAALAEARADGLGAQATADRIEALVEAGPWSTSRVRAEVIARTEVKYSQNYSVVEHARANGVVQMMVFDARLGDTDEVCEELDGAIVSAADAVELAAAEHPNGTRSFAPHYEDDE